MSVKKEANGRRSVEVTIEVPGTPEEVWQAIATGPGISSWFVPATIEEHDGTPVACTLEFGPGMSSRSIVKTWKPLQEFTRESDGWVPGSPPLGTEFHIEARAGGTCVVRVVQSLFADTDDWDGQLTGAEEGWPGIFRILHLYLTHFRGQPSATMQLMAPVSGTPADAWAALTNAAGIGGVSVGQQFVAPAGTPAFGGVVEYVSDSPFGALLRLDTPGPGVAALGTIEFGSTVMATVTFFMYGDDANDVAARMKPQWQAWLQERFPMPS
ncbi:MAG TPA: SRPBCC domain-containing protein [Gemmatimonas sp.]|uniref:SRPBCC family protein n=1 Tax=Gemmatimonas sp. TaxID=1962908 RepID=UPI002ED98AFB